MQDNFNHLADRGWAEMHRILDKELPEKKPRRRFAIWWLLFPILLGAAIWVYSFNKNQSKATDVAIAPIKTEQTKTNLNDEFSIASKNALETRVDKPQVLEKEAVVFPVPERNIKSNEKPRVSEAILMPPVNKEKTIFDQINSTQSENTSATLPMAKNLKAHPMDESEAILEDEPKRAFLDLFDRTPLRSVELSFIRDLSQPKFISVLDQSQYSTSFLQFYLGGESAIPANFKGYAAGFGIGKDFGSKFLVAGNIGIRRLHYTSSNKSELELSFDDESIGINSGGEEDLEVYNNFSQSDLIDNITFLDFNLDLKYKLTRKFGVLLDLGLSRLLSVNNVFPETADSPNAAAIGGDPYILNGKKFLEETHVLNSTLWSVDLGLFYNINEQLSIQASYGLMTNKLLADNNVADLQLLSEDNYKYRALAVQMNYRFLDFE